MNTTNKSFGVAAIIIAVLAIFVPVFGPWMSILVAGLAVLATGTGFAMGLAAIILSAINVMMLSPSIWLAASAGHSFGTFLVIVQVVAAGVLFVKNKKEVAVSKTV